MKRKEVILELPNKDGTTMKLTMWDGITIEDVLVHGLEAEAYRVVTGLDKFPTINRNIKDYLIKLKVIT